jgi:hypothetical protein
MTRFKAIVLAVLCLLGTLAAQEKSQEDKSSSKTAKYVYWQDSKVNAGKYGVFAKTVAEFRDAAASAAPDTYWIVGSPVTGDNSTFTFVTFQDSMAGVEKFMSDIGKTAQAVVAKNASFDQETAESDGGSNSALAKYNEELSLHPDAVPMADTAYWMTELFELRPGCSQQFNQAAKQVMDLHTKNGDNEHWIAYNVMSGPTMPAVFFVVPMKTLAEMDQEPTAASKQAFQSPAVQSLLNSVSKECIAHISARYYKVEPGLSRPMPSLVTANPSFWTVKQETVSASPMKKSKKKKM